MWLIVTGDAYGMTQGVLDIHQFHQVLILSSMAVPLCISLTFCVVQSSRCICIADKMKYIMLQGVCKGVRLVDGASVGSHNSFPCS